MSAGLKKKLLFILYLFKLAIFYIIGTEMPGIS